MGDAHEKKVQEYKDSLRFRAEEIVLKSIPMKIVELNKLLATEQFGQADVSKVYQPLNTPVPEPIPANSDGDQPGPRKRKFGENSEGVGAMAGTYGLMPCNKHLCELIEVVKPYVLQLLQDIQVLKMWITFMIPKTEDGNNSGVSIQREVLFSIHCVEVATATFFAATKKYFLTRGSILSEVMKTPEIEDYRRYLQEQDEAEYLVLHITLRGARNDYAGLYEIIMKNIEKIKKPRSTDVALLY